MNDWHIELDIFPRRDVANKREEYKEQKGGAISDATPGKISAILQICLYYRGESSKGSRK